MGESSPQFDIGQIAEEHEDIRHRLERIEKQSDIAQLEHAFAALIPLLEEHFRLEEDFNKSNMIDALNVAADARRLLEIANEHPELLEGAYQIKGQLAEHPAYCEVQQQIADFVNQIRHHEERETEVFMHAVWTDIGG